MKRLICWFKGHDWVSCVWACRRCGKLLEDDPTWRSWKPLSEVEMKPGDVLHIPHFDSVGLAGKRWHTADGDPEMERRLEEHLFPPQGTPYVDHGIMEHDGLALHQHVFIKPSPYLRQFQEEPHG